MVWLRNATLCVIALCPRKEEPKVGNPSSVGHTYETLTKISFVLLNCTIWNTHKKQTFPFLIR